MSKFLQPFFVTPHAVDRFQKRVHALPRGRVLMEVQHALQYPLLVVEEDWCAPADVYACVYRYGDGTAKPYYAVVSAGEGAWPAVTSIKGEGSVVHRKLLQDRRTVDRKGRAAIMPVSLDTVVRRAQNPESKKTPPRTFDANALG